MCIFQYGWNPGYIINNSCFRAKHMVMIFSYIENSGQRGQCAPIKRTSPRSASTCPSQTFSSARETGPTTNHRHIKHHQTSSVPFGFTSNLHPPGGVVGSQALFWGPVAVYRRLSCPVSFAGGVGTALHFAALRSSRGSSSCRYTTQLLHFTSQVPKNCYNTRGRTNSAVSPPWPGFLRVPTRLGRSCR